MYLYTKFIFIILICFSYSVTYLISNNRNLKALNKIFVIFLTSLLLLAILFQGTIMSTIATLVGVGRGPDAVLYLFIYLSLSINFLLAKKIINLEENMKKVVQKISFIDYEKM